MTLPQGHVVRLCQSVNNELRGRQNGDEIRLSAGTAPQKTSARENKPDAESYNLKLAPSKCEICVSLLGNLHFRGRPPPPLNLFRSQLWLSGDVSGRAAGRLTTRYLSSVSRSFSFSSTVSSGAGVTLETTPASIRFPGDGCTATGKSKRLKFGGKG